MALKVTDASIKELIQDDLNANEGTVRGRGMHEDSISRLKLGRSILVDRNNRIIAGNKTAQVAGELDAEVPVTIIDTYGDELIAVRRMDLDLTDPNGKARELALADNRVGQVNLNWHKDALKAMPQETLDTYFRHDELKKIGVLAKDDSGAEKEDVAFQATKTYHFKQGDSILLGSHLLKVGAELDEVDVIIGAWEEMTGAKAQVVKRRHASGDS